MNLYSSVLALPLGVVIVPSESTACLTEGFQSLLALLDGDDAFYQRGRAGPSCFMTDDSEAEIKALKNVWPRYSYRLIALCIRAHE